MSIRPVDLQVAVPRMAEADKSHKMLEQPQHDQTFAHEVRQMLSRKEYEVQPHDEVQHAMIRHQDKRQHQQEESRQKEATQKEKKKKTEEGPTMTADPLRGGKLDVRI